MEIHIGWNRVIRRIFQRLGYEVEALDRVMFAGMTKKNIKKRTLENPYRTGSEQFENALTAFKFII